MRNRLTLLLLFAMFMLIAPAYAAEDEVNLTDFPQQLSTMLNIDLFAAQLLTSGIFLCLFLFPSLMLAGKENAVLVLFVVGLPVMGFCIAMGWLSFWFLVVIVFSIAGLFAYRVKEWFA